MSQLTKISKDQQISQHPQMCVYFVTSKLATSSKLVPYSKQWKSIPSNDSSMQKKEKQLYLASPTEFQTLEKLHSIRHEQTYNEAKDDLQFPLHINTSNKN